MLALPTTPAALKGHLAKWEAIFARLLLTLHAVETVSAQDGIVGLAPEVHGDTARKARDLMLKFFLPHGVRFYGEFLRDQDATITDAAWIGGHILARKLDRITMSAIKEAYRALETDEGAIMRAMEHLQRARWVEEPTHPRAASTQWAVNPRVHVLYAERAKAEAARREAVREKIAQAQATIERGLE
jgi:hypothetical protein